MLKGINLLKRFKMVRRNILRKKVNVLTCFHLAPSNLNLRPFRRLSFFFRYFTQEQNSLTAMKGASSYKLLRGGYENTKILTITQRTSNIKATLTVNGTNVSTFSIGSLLKHFKVKQGKFMRRSVKGTKILISSLKSILKKKYSVKNALLLVKLSGFNYNLTSAKRSIYSMFADCIQNEFIFLVNVRISFTKQKQKAKKSLKKRLKKKILLNFLKSNKINLI